MNRFKKVLNCLGECLRDMVSIIFCSKLVIDEDHTKSAIVDLLSNFESGLGVKELVDSIFPSVAHNLYAIEGEDAFSSLHQRVENILEEMVQNHILRVEVCGSGDVKYFIEGGNDD